MVEQLICNQQVKGSSPFVSSLPKHEDSRNQQTPRAETRGVCCQGKSRGARAGGTVGCPSGQREQTVNLPRLALRRFESFPHHFVARGRSSVGRASAFQAEGHGFEPRRPLCTKNARVAQSVERVLGKDEVTGSIPVASSGDGVLRCQVPGVGCQNPHPLTPDTRNLSRGTETWRRPNSSVPSLT